MSELPLFPLQTVLLPDGRLALRVFEPRYLDMVARCLRGENRFGVIAIREGAEVGAATTYDSGTSAEIVDWHQEQGGLLGILAAGRTAFRLVATRREVDGLYVGEVAWLDTLPPQPLPKWKTAEDLDGLGEAIKQAVEGEVPATFVSVSQPIEDRVNELLAGSRADVVIKVFGQDLNELKKTADDIGKVVRDIPGRGDWRVQRVLGLPLLEVKPDRQRLARYGMSAPTACWRSSRRRGSAASPARSSRARGASI